MEGTHAIAIRYAGQLFFSLDSLSRFVKTSTKKILSGNGNEFFKVSLDKNFEQRITSIFLINKIPSIRTLITWKILLFSFSP